jgi:hypothetical protein
VKYILNRDRDRLVALWVLALMNEPKLRTSTYDLGLIGPYDDLAEGAEYDEGSKLWTIRTKVSPYKRHFEGYHLLGTTEMTFNPPRGVRGQTRYRDGHWQVYRARTGWHDLPLPAGVH